MTLFQMQSKSTAGAPTAITVAGAGGSLPQSEPVALGAAETSNPRNRCSAQRWLGLLLRTPLPGATRTLRLMLRTIFLQPFATIRYRACLRGIDKQLRVLFSSIESSKAAQSLGTKHPPSFPGAKA